MQIVKLSLNETICYIIPVENKYLLIDTGYEKHKNLFHKRLRDLNSSIN
jgi:hypothetical protein